MSCGFYAGSTIPTIIECTMFSMGISTDIFILLVFFGFLLLALYARIDFTMSLGFAWIISYTLFLAFGPGSIVIEYIMNLLGLAIAIKVGVSLLRIMNK